MVSVPHTPQQRVVVTATSTPAKAPRQSLTSRAGNMEHIEVFHGPALCQAVRGSKTASLRAASKETSSLPKACG
jgi:hypothetical protein